MRTITNLLSLDGRVYVYLKNEAVARKFLMDAEAEDFTFGDGTKPSEKEASNFIVINLNMTVSYATLIGRIALQCAEMVSGSTLVRIDYSRYITDAEDYVMYPFELM